VASDISDQDRLNLKKNLRKTGHNDFSSTSVIKTIIDMDTNQKLDSVRSIGAVNDYLHSPFYNFFSNDERSKLLSSGVNIETSEFANVPLKYREKMVKGNLWNPPTSIISTIKVGDKENSPSYKSTRWADSFQKLLHNMDKGVVPIKGDGTRGVTNIDKIRRMKDQAEVKLQRVLDLARKTSSVMIGDKELFLPSYVKNKLDMLSAADSIIDNQGNPYLNKQIPLVSEGLAKLNKVLDKEIPIILKYAKESVDMEINIIDESVESSEYNTDMTSSQAKHTLATLSQSIINDNKKKVSQYTANIYANIITKNLLPIWAKGFTKVSITLDSYQSFHTFEFKTPPMTQDFVSRFIHGRESLNGLIHRSNEIKIRMSPRIFHTMKDPNDAYHFFKSAIQYYDQKLVKVSHKLMGEVMKLGHNMKHLIANSKLSGLVTYPLSLLFVFDDVNMDSRDTFTVSSEDVQAVNRFVKNIASHYAAPEKEKKEIVEDLKEMIKGLREACEMSDTIRELYYLPESVEKLYSGGFDDMIAEATRLFIEDQTDYSKSNDPQLQYIKEAWGVKKLKKIPADLIAYITIETESIRDANDKMMICSYTLGKLDIVDWYIELLEVGSKKYVVPHTKPYLESLRTQLLDCFKKIMNTPIPKVDRPIIDIKYPKGYEG
jgi:hypothetical protein